MEQVDKDDQGADHAVWASNMLMQPQNLFGFSCAGYERDPEEWVANLRRMDRGEPVPADFIPDVMWSDDADDDRVQRLPHLSRASNFLVVSETLADVLRRFDLGASRLVPVTLLHRDRTTPYAGTYLILDLRERKEAFEPEYSKKFDRPLFPDLPSHKFLGSVSGRPQDGDISVNSSALVGANIWRDPRLLKSMFFSGPLMTAMRKAKVLGGVWTFRCPVVTVH